MPVLVLGALHWSVLLNQITEYFQVRGYSTMLDTKYRLNVTILLEYRFYIMVNNLEQCFHARANMNAEYKSYLHFLSKTIYFKEIFCLGVMERMGRAILLMLWGIDTSISFSLLRDRLMEKFEKQHCMLFYSVSKTLRYVLLSTTGPFTLTFVHRKCPSP